MKQALEAYHQDMLESGKYSSLNAVQLWDDLHYTLTSLTNKFIPSKLCSTRNKSTKNSNGLLEKETELFRNIVHQVKLLIEKSFLTSSTSSESPSNFLINPTLRIFLMWPQMILPPNPIQKNSLHFSNIPNKILPLLHLYANTIRSIRTTPRKPLFLMNSSSLF